MIEMLKHPAVRRRVVPFSVKRYHELRDLGIVPVKLEVAATDELENQISIWLSQEACLGVKWNPKGCSGSLRNARRDAALRRIPQRPLRPRSPSEPMRSATKQTADSE